MLIDFRMISLSIADNTHVPIYGNASENNCSVVQKLCRTSNNRRSSHDELQEMGRLARTPVRIQLMAKERATILSSLMRNYEHGCCGIEVSRIAYIPAKVNVSPYKGYETLGAP